MPNRLATDKGGFVRLVSISSKGSVVVSVPSRLALEAASHVLGEVAEAKPTLFADRDGAGRVPLRQGVVQGGDRFRLPDGSQFESLIFFRVDAQEFGGTAVGKAGFVLVGTESAGIDG